MKTNYIFVTGGVLSGLGKGVSAASIGALLKSAGLKVFVQKLDPYYNSDPGTMSPYQHGEVYVTSDGAETDLDLGHYERFIDEKFTKESNFTQGRILSMILKEEREGVYEGKTVQVVPHVTDKIESMILSAGENSKADIVIVEIGGTVGDIESQPFLYAISHLGRKYPNNTMFINTTYIPYLSASHEFKSKPAQQSISLMKSLGVKLNMLLLRANREIPQEMVEKISSKVMLNPKMTIPVPNVNNVYKIPTLFEKYNVLEKILDFFNIKHAKPDLTKWNEFVDKIDQDKKYNFKVGFVGKYVEFHDAYKSIYEAIKISGIWNNANIKVEWIQSENINEKNVDKTLKDLDGIIILPGFGKRGFDGKVVTASWARENDIPTLGICYGFQAMVVDQAKRQGIKDATSSEVSDNGTFVIDILRGKSKTDNLGGTLRLGESKTIHAKNSLVEKLYGSSTSIERHRHRYEANPELIDKIVNDEFKISGRDEKTKLADVCEIKNKKYFIGVQSHPEFNARPLKPHPLFEGLVKAIIKNDA